MKTLTIRAFTAAFVVTGAAENPVSSRVRTKSHSGYKALPAHGLSTAG